MSENYYASRTTTMADIEAIRVRHGQEGRGEYFATVDMNGAGGRLDWVRFNKHEMPLVHQDRATLLAEVERLEAVIATGHDPALLHDLELAHKEVDRLRAANESAAVCAEHIPEFTSDGCLVCDLNAAEKEVERLRHRKEFWKDEATYYRDDLIATNARLLAAEQEVERLRTRHDNGERIATRIVLKYNELIDSLLTLPRYNPGTCEGMLRDKDGGWVSVEHIERLLEKKGNTLMFL